MKILAQESSWLGRVDAALFSDLKKEAFRGGRRLTPIRLDQRTVVTTAGAVAFRRRYYRDESTGRCCHPLDDVIGLSRRCRVSDEMRLTALVAASQMPSRPKGCGRGTRGSSGSGRTPSTKAAARRR